MKKIDPKFEEFFTENKVFTSTKAARVGIDRKYLRNAPDVMSLGAFPVKSGQRTRLENIWTRDIRLVELVKKSKKLGHSDHPALKIIVDEIEAIVREKLGFDLPTNSEVSNGNNEEAGQNSEAKGNAEVPAAE